MRKLTIILLVLLAQSGVLNAEVLTPEKIAEKFNLRTIRSSFGPMLSQYCESYPVEFFNDKEITYDENRVIFDNDINYFVLRVVDNDKIKVSDQILPPGNYYFSQTVPVYFDKKHGDIRAKEIFISVPKPCVSYSKEKAK